MHRLLGSPTCSSGHRVGRRGTSQPDPRPGRRARRARHRRRLPHRPRPDRRQRRARRAHLPVHHDRRVRRASPAPTPSSTSPPTPCTAPPSTGIESTSPATTSPPASRWPGCAERNVVVVDADCQLLQHRRGTAPLRRPGRRRGLPLLPVRNRRRQADVRVLRPARPEGHVRHHRHRARALAGDLQRRATARTSRRRQDAHVRHHAADEHLPGRADRRAVRLLATTPTPTSTARSRWASSAASRWPNSWTPSGCSPRPSRGSTSTTTTSACRTRSASTTSCSCPNSTPARWRTPAR